MIELQSDELNFAFPELLEQLRERVRSWVDERLDCASREEKDRLPSAREEIHRTFIECIPRVSAAVSFQRTLRMPETGKDYPLPLGLGRFSIYPIDVFANIPEAWRQRGGVILPMHKTEAVWLNFYANYPMALRVGAGGYCAVSGEPWAPGLRSLPQNYVVMGSQPWLDGFHAGPQVVRQFLAQPQGQGVLSVHALSGEERWGGLQLQAYPLRVDEFWHQNLKEALARRWDELMTPIPHRQVPPAKTADVSDWTFKDGGKIRLKILPDPYGLPNWDSTRSSRCFAHFCLSEDWQRLTGIRPPQTSPTVADYRAAGVSWADLEGEKPPEEGDSILSDLLSESSEGSRSPVPGSSHQTLVPRIIFRIDPHQRQQVREF